MSKFIPLSVPNLKGNEEKYVVDAIRSEWVSTGGQYINQFESKLAEYVGVKNAVACQSGTAGIHLALQISGVGVGDEVIVPTLTFIAAINPVKYLNAEPIFIDCDHTLCIDMEKVRKFCEEECHYIDGKLINNKTRNHIKAIVVVHIFGNLANMEEAKAIAAQYNLKIIEDATEALGTYYINETGKKVFAGTIGDFGIYSFNGNKIITTGGGGMLVAKSEDDLAYAKYLSTQAKDDEVYYIHHDIGYNYRMTNIQAAIGLAQLEQLEEFISIKSKNYNYYSQLIGKNSAIKFHPFREDIRPNYWFYSVVVDLEKSSLDKNSIIDRLKEKGIQTRPIWGLIHEQLPYKSNQEYEIDLALSYQSTILNIPCSSNLMPEDVEHVVGCMQEILG